MTPVRHPLDPLTEDEFRAVTAVLSRERGVDGGWRYASIELKEPAKDVSRSYAAPAPIERRARVVLWNRADGIAYKAVVRIDGDAGAGTGGPARAPGTRVRSSRGRRCPASSRT